MVFSVVTLFPEVLEPYLAASILGRARSEGIISLRLINIRDFATDKHKTVDDTPYGGGAGMVLKIEPIARAISSINDQFSIFNFQSRTNKLKTKKRRIVVLSARGAQFTQAKAQEYAQLEELVLICGRYEGIDQRVADYLADEEISIGPYVLSGGEIAALAVVEATARLVPGVLGNEGSLAEESFSQNQESQLRPRASLGEARIPTSPKSFAGRGKNQEGDMSTLNSKFDILDSSREYPQYTKPADYKGWKVPEALLSGNHEEIRKWRAAERRDY